mgnify:CR=1 FL=1
MGYATIEFNGLEFEVQYFYQPEEKDELEHQGCGESFDIESIKLGDVKMDGFFIESDLYEEIQEALNEYMDNNDNF